MTIYKITPQFINGSVLVPSSKSMGHRMCICAGLSGRNCIVDLPGRAGRHNYRSGFPA